MYKVVSVISSVEIELNEMESVQLSKVLSAKKWTRKECETFDAEIWHDENDHVYSIVDEGKAFYNINNKMYLKDPLAKKLLDRLIKLEDVYIEEMQKEIDIK